jgi:hypothetical protein
MIGRKQSKIIHAGLVAVVLSGLWLGAPSRTLADTFRNAADAPATWGAFSKRLKLACETALHADNPMSRRLNTALSKLRTTANPDEPPMRVKVSLWISPIGGIDRVSFPPLGSEQATSDLNALLTQVTAGAPPPDMLQPVQLLLSLAPQK